MKHISKVGRCSVDVVPSWNHISLLRKFSERQYNFPFAIAHGIKEALPNRHWTIPLEGKMSPKFLMQDPSVLIKSIKFPLRKSELHFRLRQSQLFRRCLITALRALWSQGVRCWLHEFSRKRFSLVWVGLCELKSLFSCCISQHSIQDFWDCLWRSLMEEAKTNFL